MFEPSGEAGCPSSAAAQASIFSIRDADGWVPPQHDPDEMGAPVAADWILGYGDDRVSVGNGDRTNVGAGADPMAGGAGQDTSVVRNAGDTGIEAVGSAAVQRLTIRYATVSGTQARILSIAPATAGYHPQATPM